MYGKKSALAALLVATATGYAGAADLPVKAAKAVPDQPFFFVNQNWLSYGYQFTATDPGISKTAKNTVDFIHFDVWAYGVNFFDIQWLKSDSRDPVGGGAPNSGPAGETEIYGLVRSSFGFNQIFNTKAFSAGPLTNVSFEIGGDGNSANGGTLPEKKDIVAGLDFSFMLPYKGHLDISPLYYKEWNQYSGGPEPEHGYRLQRYLGGGIDLRNGARFPAAQRSAGVQRPVGLLRPEGQRFSRSAQHQDRVQQRAAFDARCRQYGGCAPRLL
jgi:hypothetical protein